jgi:hypothetical protein
MRNRKKEAADLEIMTKSVSRPFIRQYLFNRKCAREEVESAIFYFCSPMLVYAADGYSYSMSNSKLNARSVAIAKSMTHDA